MRRWTLRAQVAAGAALLATALLNPAPLTAQVLVEITDPANPIVAEPSPGSYMGTAWVDVDGDGLLDLFMARRTAIFHNLGGGSFAKIDSVILDQGNCVGTTWADYDNDGDIDCFTSGGNQATFGRGSILYRNDGGFSFAPIASGDIGQQLDNSGWGSSFADFDFDGYADIVVAAANGFAGVTHENRLFHNNGNGTFTRIDSTAITDTLGAYTVPTWSDYDLDGDVDLFIGSGPITVFLPDNHYRNLLRENGYWSFEKITTTPIATDSLDGQVWNWIDYDNDGDLDAFQTNYNAGINNNLYRNDGGAYLRMTAADAGDIVDTPGQGLANLWGDFDNDGDLDCVVTNDSFNPCDYFENLADGTFLVNNSLPLATKTGPHYGATAGDYDRDGDLDLYVAGKTAGKALYRNDTDNGNHWLELTLTGAGAPGGSNRSALGARVRARATIGGTPVWQMREVSAQNSFCSMNMLDLHFGLGDAATVDSLVITWPSGAMDVRSAVPADQLLAIDETEATGVPAESSSETVPSPSPWRFPNPFRPGARLGFTLERAGHARLTIHDVRGRRVAVLADGVMEAGAFSRAWSGRDEEGSPARPGVYFVHLEAPGVDARAKLVLVR